jgi:hypothetical protein
MKKILTICLALSLAAMLTACGGNNSQSSTQPSQGAQSSAETSSSAEAGSNVEAPAASDADAATTDLFFSSEVTALEGTWTLSQVYADGATTDAVADAMSLKISLELDPSELVDEAAYIHNQVYNLTGNLSFGLDAITDVLSADDVDYYKGSTAWSDFPQGEVVKDGEFYKQPGPATMRFKDVDDYGLFLDQVAGVSADIDTTQKNLIIGLNNQGQLLLGYSEEHMERPSTDGEWVYCLIFDQV